MELRHISGCTYVIEAATALLTVYQSTGRNIILIDTGLADQDRSSLTELIDTHGFCLQGIVCSHAHFDHTGNARYLQQRYQCPVAMPLAEAGLAVTPDAYRSNYVALTYAQSHRLFADVCVKANVIIPPDAASFSFCGVSFGVLQLPGHTAGQIGIVTPDNVAYLSDCLIGRDTMEHAKLPTIMNVAQDMDSKYTLLSLHCSYYIIAHKEVLPDVQELVTYNLSAIEARIEKLLCCLREGMTHDQWLSAFCQTEAVHTQKDLKLSILERNFNNFLSYLEDTGRIATERENTVKRYRHVKPSPLS
ncbi:MAG: MBL fold metallo-hydrolase [Clostridiales bacterium]|nr:MBL fold metallo-hydrolase [Clostridiales bacterium]